MPFIIFILKLFQAIQYINESYLLQILLNLLKALFLIFKTLLMLDFSPLGFLCFIISDRFSGFTDHEI